MSFRIYNNIPKTIITPQIKTLSIPFTITDGTDEQEIGEVPVNICILAAKITLITLTTPYTAAKIITLLFKNNNDNLYTQLSINKLQTIGYNPNYIGQNGLKANLFYIPDADQLIPSQEAVIEFSYYQL